MSGCTKQVENVTCFHLHVMLHVLNVVFTCRYLVPGWRLGWVLIYDKNEAFESEVMNSLKSYQ